MFTKKAAMINPKIEPIVREFKQALQALYGDRLHNLVLFGSYARGDYDDESDIDILVILNDETVDTIDEVFRMAELTSDFILKHGYAISPLPVARMKYNLSFMPVYQEARREGLFI